MNDKLTELVVVMDRSGSMSNIAKDMEGGFDALIADQKKGAGECRVSLVQFDSVSVDKVYTAVPVAEVQSCMLIPRGGTPLLDALGQTVVSTGERFAAMNEQDRPARVVFLVITDGEENASREFTKKRIKELVEEQQKVYKWEFVFLGANVDAFSEAHGLGIAKTSAANFMPDALSTRSAYKNVSATLSSYRGGAAASMSLTDDQRADILKPTPSISSHP